MRSSNRQKKLLLKSIEVPLISSLELCLKVPLGIVYDIVIYFFLSLVVLPYLIEHCVEHLGHPYHPAIHFSS